jgi:hypothetical protein
MRMSHALHLLLSSALLVAHSGSAADRAAPTTNAPDRIELRDQFNTPQSLTFPTTQLTLLTIANKKGSEQIAGWVAPVMKRFGGRIDVCGVADVSSVPGPLRGMVREAFQRSQTYPVMMDWSGDVVKQFGYAPGEVEIFLLDRGGRILQRHRGKINHRAAEELFGGIERALVSPADQTNPSGPP